MKMYLIRSLLFAFLGLSLIPISAFPMTYPMPAPGNDIVGENFVTEAQQGDSLRKIGNRFEISLREMRAANPEINAQKILTVGQKILVPARFILPIYRQGIVINMPELRLYYFTPDGKQVITYPVALGRNKWRTPLGYTTVIKKVEAPAWRVPPSIQRYMYQHKGIRLPPIIPPGPNNPLGPYALYLGMPGYLIHGTNQPDSIGKFVSSGCVRLYNDDIQDLFYRASIGTSVHIINHPYKVGWQDNKLYLESQALVELGVVPSEFNQLSWRTALSQKIDGKITVIDWNAANLVAKAHTGIPIIVGEVSQLQVKNENFRRLE